MAAVQYLVGARAMKLIKDNIWWVAPAAAIGLFASGTLSLDLGMDQRDANAGKVQAQEVQNAQDDIDTAQQRRVGELNTYVEAAVTSQPTPEASTDVVAALQSLQTAPVVAPAAEAPVQQEVTRTAAVDLLSVAPQPAPETPQPKPAAVQTPTAPAITPEFFSSAQNNLAVANACAEDLNALAAQARIYFPTGGLTGDESGFNIARLIGQVLSDCPGYSIQVEGHSDPSGDPLTNKRLSERRAESVLSRLAASGIDTSNFFAVGFGDTRPSNVRGTQSAAYYDRRVEFSVIKTAQRASFNTQPQPWRTNEPACMERLETKAKQLRQFYAPGSITVPTTDLESVYALASDVVNCSGARLRLVGQHEDAVGSRESNSTGRLRALAMMSTLTAAGFPSDQILVAAPSYSVNVPGQPGLPNSRLDFQVVAD